MLERLRAIDEAFDANSSSRPWVCRCFRGLNYSTSGFAWCHRIAWDGIATFSLAMCY
jgi:hypothetical protein